MSSGLIKDVRTQHWFALVTQELNRLGLNDYEIAPPTGRGHPKLIVRHNGKVMTTPVPSSERGSGDHKYLVARIRKFAGSIEVRDDA